MGDRARQLTFGSLFAGIGGMDLGLERAGMTVRWQVEIDEYCRKVLTKHWPDVPKFADIKELDGTELEPVDLVAGGFPCQPVSVAGKGRAQQDERWLWPEFERIIRLVRPRYVLVENVPGLANRGLSDVLGSLADLGFDAEWASVPAAAVGAPHLRYRLFLVAHARGIELRNEQGRRSGASRQGASVARDNGEAGIVAYPQIFTERPGLCACGAPWQRWGRPCDGCGASYPWPAEPDVGRVADGIPTRDDRLRGLGNAVVPQVAEWVGRRIIEAAA